MPASTNDRRGVILDRAAVLFAQKGISATTVREIADSVGILSGSLYHHFASKDEMVHAIVSSYIEDILSRYDAVLSADDEPRVTLERLIHASIRASAEHPHATEIYQNNRHYMRQAPEFGDIQDGSARIQNTWIDTIRAGVDSGSLRDDVDPNTFYRLLRDSLWLSVRWAKPQSEAEIDRLAADCTKVFLEGFAVR